MILFLFLLIPIFCTENNRQYNNIANYDRMCSDKYEGCSFNISYTYPISPKIPTSIPYYAKLDNYRYIYLSFTIPITQKQKSFYLEAYDTSNGETIISNGDCYLINTNENKDYEIRIYKELKENSYIRFGFFGIPQNFIMSVKLQFPLNILLWATDIPLDHLKSLNRKNVPSLGQYLAEKDKQISQQQNRMNILKSICSEIMGNIFKTRLDLNLFGDPFFSTFKIPSSPYFVVTISSTVGLELITENVFLPEKNILSETTIKDGKIDTHYDGLDFLKGKLYVHFDLLKIMESYDKIVEDMALKFGKENDYTLTVSTDEDVSYELLTLRYYYGKTKKIYFEIQIKIQFNNLKLKELATMQMKNIPYLPYRGIDNPSMSNMSLKEKKFIYFLSGISYVIGVSRMLGGTDLFSTAIMLPIFFKKDNIDTAELGGTFLDMEKDENGIYHAMFDCWQAHFGFTKFYDIVFDAVTDMKSNTEGMFTYNRQNYILWAWKGNYINLGAGAELGIYKGGKNLDSFWEVDKSLAMPMTLTLTHKNYGTIVDNWNNRGNDTWWITAFNPRIAQAKADDLTAYFSVEFKDENMFKEFAKKSREGWRYDKKTKVAYLTL